jgi:hypothetical protein
MKYIGMILLTTIFLTSCSSDPIRVTNPIIIPSNILEDLHSDESHPIKVCNIKMETIREYVNKYNDALVKSMDS